MIITNEFNNALSKKINKYWAEAEADPSGLELEVGIVFDINKLQFRKCLEYILSICTESIEHDETLDVSYRHNQTYANKRYSIIGKQRISEFCNNEKSDFKFDEIMIKEKLTTLSLQEYFSKIRISKETKYNTENDGGYNTEIEKSYRLKKRYSAHFDSDFKIDFTIVKSGKGKKFSSFKLSPDKYEIEIEYIGKDKPNIEKLFDYLEEVLKNLRDEIYLTQQSDKGKIVSEYINIIRNYVSIPNDYDNLLVTYPKKFFVGPQPVTLQSENLASLQKDYSVTDKADGQRFLLFINKTGNIFLINNKIQIKNTLLKCKEKTNPCNSSILDCEVIKLLTGKYLILCFDIYTFNNTKVFDDKNLMERIKIIEDQIIGNISKNKDSVYEIKCKKFYFDIKEGAKEILRTKYAYETDGLIYTPTLDPPPLGKTWHKVFKWKEPKNNTIDFLAVIKKYDNGEDIIKDNSKILMLYVFGLSSGGPKQYFEKTTNKFDANLFIPDNSGEWETWQTKVECDEKGMIYCKSGDEITNNAFVEMSFDFEKGQWIPLRIRYDKTSPNSFQNANAVWQTIINPIEKNHIIDLVQKDIADNNKIESDKYYSRDIERDKSLTLSMVTFHNFWVKNVSLIGKFKNMNSSSNKSILDLACGKGGDIHKWINNNFTTAIGIDIYEDNITNKIDGAYKRLSEMSTKLGSSAKYAFVPLDTSKIINREHISKSIIKDEYLRTLANNLWGFEKTPHLHHLYNVANAQFDVVSVQFAIHYFFENEEKLDNLITNINTHLKNGGFFIGTCFDGTAVANLLKDDEIVTGKNKDKTIWSIKKKYKEYEENTFGQEIEVYVETINKHHIEYLVSYELLKNKLAKHGIYPLSQRDCNKYGFINSCVKFDILFNQMYDKNKHIIETTNKNNPTTQNKVIQAYKMKDCPDEMTFSFLNMMFVFCKKRNE